MRHTSIVQAAQIVGAQGLHSMDAILVVAAPAGQEESNTAYMVSETKVFIG